MDRDWRQQDIREVKYIAVSKIRGMGMPGVGIVGGSILRGRLRKCSEFSAPRGRLEG